MSDSGENNHKIWVAFSDVSDEKVNDGFSFVFGEDVGSHVLSIAEIALKTFPFYNSNVIYIQSCRKRKN